MPREQPHALLSGRREFLSRLSAAAAGLAAFRVAAGEGSPAPAASPMPTIRLGSYQVSRLIAGWNPVGGYSYLGHHMDQQMRAYFTVERTVDYLERCEREGINTHQFSPSDKSTAVLRVMRERGSRMQFICLHSGRAGIKDTIATTTPFAMVHHGGATDRLFQEGKAQEVHDYVKEAHDRGVLAGVSADNPDCIRRVAEEGWEVDFFMTCFYFLTRKQGPEDNHATLEVSYGFRAGDPLVMTEVVRQVKQPCLGFKILASGRLCANENMVRERFRFAFSHIKPSDGVIVGMYPRFFDEVRANAEYTRELGKPAPQA